VSTTQTREKERHNRTVTLHLGNTLEEYEWYLTDEGRKELLHRVEVADSIDWGHLGDGHHPGCPRLLQFTYHGSYSRQLQLYRGTWIDISIPRVQCLDCEAVFTIQPSFVVRYKRQHTDAIEKLMTLLFIAEDSYRFAAVSQAFAIDEEQKGTWNALQATEPLTIAPRALWRLVQWFGQLSPAQLNLALGVDPPQRIISDEKHATENGDKAYIPVTLTPKDALIWWIDYLHSVSEEELAASLERFQGLNERLESIIAATMDGWEPTQNAFRAVFEGITIQECHLHALMNLGTNLATYKRRRKDAGRPVSEKEEQEIRDAFVKVLKAPSPEEYEQALQELPQVFDSPPLDRRKRSLQTKQALFQAWISDEKVAVVTTFLDQCLKFLARKLDNMQTFRNPESALRTLNAWAITRNCWRFLKGALREGLCPLELAGATFDGIPWMQWVNLAMGAYGFT